MSRIRNTVRKPSVFFDKMQVTLLRTPASRFGLIHNVPIQIWGNKICESRPGRLKVVEFQKCLEQKVNQISGIVFNFVFSLIFFCCCAGYGVYRQRQTKKRGARATIRNRMKETGEKSFLPIIADLG
jgi:hypothetical protein